MVRTTIKLQGRKRRDRKEQESESEAVHCRVLSVKAPLQGCEDLHVERFRGQFGRYHPEHEPHGLLQVLQLRHGLGEDPEERPQPGDGENVGRVDDEGV